MSKKYRLKVSAHVDGHIRESGHVFHLKDGERGPHRTIIKSHDRYNAVTGDRVLGEYEDVPLYEEVTD